jgi:hypothetical protein
MPTDIGRPDFGMRGVNSGAFAKTPRKAVSTAVWASRLKWSG